MPRERATSREPWRSHSAPSQTNLIHVGLLFELYSLFRATDIPVLLCTSAGHAGDHPRFRASLHFAPTKKSRVLLKATPSDTQPWALPTRKPNRWAAAFLSKFPQSLVAAHLVQVSRPFLLHLATMMKSLLILTTALALPCSLALRPGLIRIPKEDTEAALEKVLGAEPAGDEFGRLDKRRDSLKYVCFMSMDSQGLVQAISSFSFSNQCLSRALLRI